MSSKKGKVGEQSPTITQSGDSTIYILGNLRIRRTLGSGIGASILQFDKDYNWAWRFVLTTVPSELQALLMLKRLAKAEDPKALAKEYAKEFCGGEWL